MRADGGEQPYGACDYFGWDPAEAAPPCDAPDILSGDKVSVYRTLCNARSACLAYVGRVVRFSISFTTRL